MKRIALAVLSAAATAGWLVVWVAGAATAAAAVVYVLAVVGITLIGTRA